jgi:hypothetical protein
MRPRRHAEYDLTEIAACLASDSVFVARRTATEMIQAHLDVDPRTAERFARQVVARLRPGNYSGTVQLREGPADVYGIVVDGKSWYVKLHLARDRTRLHIVSCHLPDRDILTADGIVTCTQHGTRPYE